MDVVGTAVAEITSGGVLPVAVVDITVGITIMDDERALQSKTRIILEFNVLAYDMEVAIPSMDTLMQRALQQRRLRSMRASLD